LDVCAPCGSVAAGDATISGDPRLDGTIEAIQRIRRTALRLTDEFSSDIELLGSAFDVQGSGASDVVKEIKKQLFDDPDVNVAIAYEPARCWADAAHAVSAEFSCEERLGCAHTADQKRRDKCVGLFVGDCGNNDCRGLCYVGMEGGEPECPAGCIGTCGEVFSLPCPGVCVGTCTLTCSAYNSEGECFGFCPGFCNGICDSPIPFQCSGLCLGLCEAEVDEEESCAGLCYGTCADRKGNFMGEGLCRGHVWPQGYTEECSYCRETANALAWSSIACEPAKVSVSVNFSPEFSQSRDGMIFKIRTLERVLARAADAHAKLALLVDGVDDAGELQLKDLVDPIDAETADLDDAGLEDLALDARPLKSIKDRVAALMDTATKGDFQVAAGSLSCVRPAFEEAFSILDELIPEGGDSPLNRVCPEPSEDALAPCLYETIDGQAALLDLAALGI
jgi:hypothetical protein